MFLGGIVGIVAGAVGGAVMGWNDPATVTSLVTQFATNLSNGTYLK